LDIERKPDLVCARKPESGSSGSETRLCAVPDAKNRDFRLKLEVRGQPETIQTDLKISNKTQRTPSRTVFLEIKKFTCQSDSAREVHVQDQEAILPVRCMFRIKNGVLENQARALKGEFQAADPRSGHEKRV
jgi:hypothetical protein